MVLERGTERGERERDRDERFLEMADLEEFFVFFFGKMCFGREYFKFEF